MKKNNPYWLLLFVTIIFIAVLTYNKPLGRSQSVNIISQIGSVEYIGDTVYIIIPESLSVLELEAVAIIAGTAEGVVLKTIE